MNVILGLFAVFVYALGVAVGLVTVGYLVYRGLKFVHKKFIVNGATTFLTVVASIMVLRFLFDFGKNTLHIIRGDKN